LKAVTINFKDLTDCWDPVCFCGGECTKLLICKRKAKKKCKAHYIEHRIVTYKRKIFASGIETEWREVDEE